MRKATFMLILSVFVMLSTVTVSYAWLQYVKDIGETLIVVADFNIKANLYYLVDKNHQGEINENSTWAVIDKTNGIAVNYFIPGEQYLFKIEITNNSSMDAAVGVTLQDIYNSPKPTNEELSGVDYFKISYGVKQGNSINYSEPKFLRELIVLTNKDEDYHRGDVSLYQIEANPSESEIVLLPNQVHTIYVMIIYDGTGELIEHQFTISHVVVKAKQAS